MEMRGSVALVTGGARRVGRALSLGLAQNGVAIVVNYHRSAADAAETVEQIRALGGHAIAVQADVSSAAEAKRLIEETRRAFGRLDILVNNASLFERAPLLEIGEEDWDRVLGVNLKGPFFVTQAAVPMLRAAYGLVVNIADLSALQPWPSYSHHSVSKAGLVHLTRIQARALAPEIRANCIVPGTVLPPEGYQPNQEDGGDGHLTDHPGGPDDVVDALLYLVRARFVTGEWLVVDGGRTLY
jgi:NAD(P)-dependent dehydrogenase (short-subunit alcohol dehydrogenase family)